MTRDPGCPGRGMKADMEMVGGSGRVSRVPIILRICVSTSVCCRNAVIMVCNWLSGV